MQWYARTDQGDSPPRDQWDRLGDRTRSVGLSPRAIWGTGWVIGPRTEGQVLPHAREMGVLSHESKSPSP